MQHPKDYLPAAVLRSTTPLRNPGQQLHVFPWCVAAQASFLPARLVPLTVTAYEKSEGPVTSAPTAPGDGGAQPEPKLVAGRWLPVDKLSLCPQSRPCLTSRRHPSVAKPPGTSPSRLAVLCRPGLPHPGELHPSQSAPSAPSCSCHA